MLASSVERRRISRFLVLITLFSALVFPRNARANTSQAMLTRADAACTTEATKGVINDDTPDPRKLAASCSADARRLIQLGAGMPAPYRVRAIEYAYMAYGNAARGARQLGQTKEALAYLLAARRLAQQCLYARDANSDQRDLARTTIVRLDSEIEELQPQVAPTVRPKPAVRSRTSKPHPTVSPSPPPPPCTSALLNTVGDPIPTWRVKKPVSIRFETVVQYLPFMQWFERIGGWKRLDTSGDGDVDALAEDAVPSYVYAKEPCTPDQSPIDTIVTVTLVPEH